HSSSDPEMVEGRSDGGRRMEGHGDGDSARFGDLAAACEHLSALRVRPMGGPPGAGSARKAMSLSSDMRMVMLLVSSTWQKETASWRSFGNGCGSSAWNCTQTKRAGLSSGGSPKSTGPRQGKGNPRRSIFWDSRISAGRTGTEATR